MLRSTLTYVLLALVPLLAWGCRKSGLEGLVPASGSVTFKGKPIEGADIAFSPESGGRAASAKSDAQGNFQLTTLNPNDGAQPGSYKVAISKRRVTNSMTAQEAEAWFATHDGPPPTTPVENELPENYGNANTSGLSATVTEGGDNRFTFELK